MKKKRILIGVLGAVLIICSVTIPVIAWAAGNSRKAPDSLYEKPAIGEILKDGEYPEEIKSSSSALAKEKEWYEYITYSKTPIGTVEFTSNIFDAYFNDKILSSSKQKMRIVYYDPYDYSYGMTMEVSDVQDSVGTTTLTEFSTANSLNISYSHTSGETHSGNVATKLGFAEDTEAGAIWAKVTVKFSQEISSSRTDTSNYSDTDSRSMTFNAIYFNANGTPYAWKVVHYAVTLPLYCEIQTYINGNWVTTDTDYLLLTTIQGTCREYIKNEVAYIEHWGTGEPVTVDDFWDGFFSKENLKKAYQNKLLPNN